MEDKRNELIGKFNQLRLELGAIELSIDYANQGKQKVLAQLKAVQTQYDQVNAAFEKAKATAGMTPVGQEPEVGLTDDAKREMQEALSLQTGGENAEAPAQAPSEATGT